MMLEGSVVQDLSHLQSRCADKTYLNISARKSLVFNNMPVRPLWNYFEMFIIFCSVTVRTEKDISSDLLGIIRWFKR